MRNYKNLLFIEGNRQKIDKANIKEAYMKIKKHGYLATMPIEYLPMEKAKDKLNDRSLFKVTVVRKSGNGEPNISNFDIKSEAVKLEDYANYDGVCIDGQHRSLALQFDEMREINPSYITVDIPDNMDILSYVALRNNGKTWKNTDFTHSGISTQSKEIDHIIKKCETNKEEDAFLHNIYTLDTITIRPNHIKSLQLGYQTIDKFRNLQLSPESIEKGDVVLKAVKENGTLSSDRCNGRLGAALKKFYVENDKDFNALIGVISLINNNIWEAHFIPEKGHSMEIKAYTDALKSVWVQYQGENK